MKYEKNRKIVGIDEYKVMKIAKILIIPVIALILVLIIILVDKKNKTPAKPDPQTAAASVEAAASNADAEVSVGNTFDEYGLQQNAVPEVNEVVAKYQRAKVTGDAELMYRVFGKQPDDEMTMLQEKLSEESKAYESYDHTVCYTTPGCEEDSYLVFIASDLKFSGIDTAAPMLTWVYVYKGKDGNFYMTEPDKLKDNQKELLTEVSSSEDVKMLDNDMRTRLAQAVINDAKLATLYQMWSDTGNAEAAPAETDPNAIHIENEETSEASENESAEEAEIIIGE